LKHANGGFNSVIDTVGGTRLAESFALLRPGGILVSAVEKPDKNAAARYGVRAEFILVSVTTRLLQRLGTLIDAGTLSVRVGEILPLSEARIAHEMLAGRTHRPGKIVLIPGA
jgi:NADPH:quinone reductase-like Zn-dependent oxidoreductase